MVPGIAIPIEIMWHMLVTHVHSASVLEHGSIGVVAGPIVDMGSTQPDRIAQAPSCWLRLISDADRNPHRAACRDCCGLAQFSGISGTRSRC